MDSKEKAAARKEYEVKVTTHVHKGEPCKPGDKISLTVAQAARLEKMGVI